MKKLKFFLCLILIVTWSQETFANGIGIINGSTGEYMTIVNSSVEVTVNNQIAVIKTTQVFRNDSDSDTQFKYGFPLNSGANPILLRWFYQGEWFEASYSPNQQNDSIPGSGDGNTIDPLLAEHLGSSPLFFTPGDTIPQDSLFTMELTYVELLPYEFGLVKFRYPNDVSSLQNQIIELQTFDFQLLSEREIVYIDLLGFETTDLISAYEAELSLSQYEEVPDQDYELEYQLTSDGLGTIALSTMLSDTLFTCDTLGTGYLTMILEPESNVDTEVIEKNFTLIIDRSGSMSGNKIVQARDAASFIINNLNTGDYFNIIDFSSDISSFFPEHVEFNVDNQNAALSYIDGIEASGSTNISGALTTAVSQFGVVDTTKANMIIFFTDGEATAGETSTNGILQAVTDEVNFTETSIFLFTFGIGESVNEGLLTLLAQQNSGLAQFIGDDAVEEEITSFFLTINNPVLLNTSVSFSPDVLEEVYPIAFPSLYQGQQLIVSGRYDSAQVVTMHIEGQAFNVPVAYDFELSLSDSIDVSMSVLPKIWAKQKIDELTYQFYTASSSDEADLIQADIDSVSVCYEVVAVDFGSFSDPGGSLEIDEISGDEPFELLVFPQPFVSLLNIFIKFEDYFSEDLRIELIDIKGRVVHIEDLEINGTELSISIDGLEGLRTGVYTLRVSSKSGSVVRSLIKM